MYRLVGYDVWNFFRRYLFRVVHFLLRNMYCLVGYDVWNFLVDDIYFVLFIGNIWSTPATVAPSRRQYPVTGDRTWQSTFRGTFIVDRYTLHVVHTTLHFARIRRKERKQERRNAQEKVHRYVERDGGKVEREREREKKTSKKGREVRREKYDPQINVRKSNSSTTPNGDPLLRPNEYRFVSARSDRYWSPRVRLPVRGY